MEFIKMHGIGNDFIIIDSRVTKLKEDLSKLAVKLCKRKFNIGGDGLVLIYASSFYDAEMKIFNPDGSEAEMCGNALRCVAQYLFSRDYSNKSKLRISTGAGTKSVIKSSGVIRVNMGEPRIKPEEIPVSFPGINKGNVVNEKLSVKDLNLKVTCVSMGNPHCVIFKKTEPSELSYLGPLIERHHFFPSKTNVEFVEIKGEGVLNIQVWERGAGRTLGCGTGACASTVAAILNGYGKQGDIFTINLPGGTLNVLWGTDGNVYMEGPAQEVFYGKIILQEEI